MGSIQAFFGVFFGLGGGFDGGGYVGESFYGGIRHGGREFLWRGVGFSSIIKKEQRENK